MIARWFIACGVTSIFMVYLIFDAIQLSIYDVMYDITITPECTLLLNFLQYVSYHVTKAECLMN